jgi:glycerophosphoryl diester phosphodiesterase
MVRRSDGFGSAAAGVLDPSLMPPRAIVATLLLPLLLGCSVRQAPALPQERRPIIFAHRGGAGEAPESTLQAMQSAIARDPKVAIELDLRESKDGYLVVIHDGTVDRTTDGQGAVEAMTLAQLKALDAAHCATPGVGRGTAPPETCRASPPATFPLRGKGYRIPTLDEVFEALPPTTLIAIEVKAAGFEEAVARRVRRSGRIGRLIVGSSLDGAAGRLSELLPEVPHYFPRWAAVRLAASVKVSNGNLSRPAYQVLATPRAGMGLRMDTPGMLRVAHELGVMVLFWTIDDPAEMRELVRLGADGIITDFPARARETLAAPPPR